MKAMIIPGNGGANVSEGWIPYVKQELEKLGLEVIAKNMPDPILARSKYWLPFIEENIDDYDTILIGHSSGAIAIVRYLETHKIKGAVLIGAYHTHLNLDSEKQSGYFDTSINWQVVKNNADWIIQFASLDDPFIPIGEARFVHNQLGTEYHEYEDKGHYNEKTQFPELVEVIKKKLSF